MKSLWSFLGIFDSLKKDILESNFDSCIGQKTSKNSLARFDITALAWLVPSPRRGGGKKEPIFVW